VTVSAARQSRCGCAPLGSPGIASRLGAPLRGDDPEDVGRRRGHGRGRQVGANCGGFKCDFAARAGTTRRPPGWYADRETRSPTGPVPPGFFTLTFVIASPRNEGVAIQLAGLLRRFAPRNDQRWNTAPHLPARFPSGVKSPGYSIRRRTSEAFWPPSRGCCSTRCERSGALQIRHIVEITLGVSTS